MGSRLVFKNMLSSALGSGPERNTEQASFLQPMNLLLFESKSPWRDGGSDLKPLEGFSWPLIEWLQLTNKEQLSRERETPSISNITRFAVCFPLWRQNLHHMPVTHATPSTINPSGSCEIIQENLRVNASLTSDRTWDLNHPPYSKTCLSSRRSAQSALNTFIKLPWSKEDSVLIGSLICACPFFPLHWGLSPRTNHSPDFVNCLFHEHPIDIPTPMLSLAQSSPTNDPPLPLTSLSLSFKATSIRIDFLSNKKLVPAQRCEDNIHF